MYKVVTQIDKNLEKVCNEDGKKIIFINSKDALKGFFVVCDGLGGHKNGRASSEFLSNYILKHCCESELEKIVLDANKQMAENDNMGLTTVSALLMEFSQRKASIVNVGDSRIYYFKQGQSGRQISKDDSSLKIIMDAYNISEAEAHEHPRYVITNVVGSNLCRPRIQEIDFDDGDAFVLITDGAYLRLEIIFAREYTFSSIRELIDDMERELVQKEAADNATILIVSV